MADDGGPSPTGTAPSTVPPTRGEAGAASRFVAGQTFGPYRLLDPLGSGGFGEVWLAERHSTLVGSRLAVKLPLDRNVDVAAVCQEAGLWARAGSHPNVLPLFEADVYDGQVVIVSEYAPDGSLARWLGRHGGRAPTVESAAELVMGVLSGLEHLHVRGIVHRDLKPGNVLMQGESPRIADFGLARFLDPAAPASLAAGTPAYMAPEAFDGHRSARSDLWSVGVLFQQLLAGALPFPAGALMRLVRSIALDPPAPLPDSVPAAVREVVARALTKDPAGRFASAADMRAAVRDAVRRLAPVAGPAGAGAPVARSVAVTGSMAADPGRAAARVRALLAPYCGPQTTWYCGTVGVVDEAAVTYLLGQGQRVIAVGYDGDDITPSVRDLLARHAVPFVDARHEPVPRLPGAPSRRDVYFSTKADLVVLFWAGGSPGTGQLLGWLRHLGKDHVVGFV